MPRPPILPTIDWPTVFTFAKGFEDWLDAAESPDQAQAINDALAGQSLEPQEEAVVQNLARLVRVVAFAEDWCGDVVRHVPVLQALSDVSGMLHVRYVTRSEHPAVFVRFLTNGGEAIPKFVFLNEAFVECGNWGPMPEACKRLIARGKACGDIGAARRLVSARYAADPGKREVIRELLELAQNTAAVAP
ncbi:MAG TPA: thioredoxin family protein [Candidatus Krumholzibacteria bacterium]|nr:thioredoxin family protein [Candidatus Krumholzibacteria bacterium]HPD72897.1 thioredoxin family protein [Candidatus Krumholzibacteria bacterium]HRY41696.1 thioredoxin family protein [Candidatus Krumholzibacteria bacterium]